MTHDEAMTILGDVLKDLMRPDVSICRAIDPDLHPLGIHGNCDAMTREDWDDYMADQRNTERDDAKTGIREAMAIDDGDIRDALTEECWSCGRAKADSEHCQRCLDDLAKAPVG